jgi:hypothetical protein
MERDLSIEQRNKGDIAELKHRFFKVTGYSSG